MGPMACTEPQCLYNGALYLYLYLYSPYGPYNLYRASVPVQWCTLPLSIPPLPLWAVRPVQSLSACTTVHFLHLKEKPVVLVTCQIIQYKAWKLSNYTARGTVQGQEMSMCTRGAGKRVNSYSMWYQFEVNMNLCVAMMQRNWFSLRFA